MIHLDRRELSRSFDPLDRTEHETPNGGGLTLALD